MSMCLCTLVGNKAYEPREVLGCFAREDCLGLMSIEYRHSMCELLLCCIELKDSTTLCCLRRRLARRKSNKVAPHETTDDYDSTDHAPHPYHMMMDPRKLHGSRMGSRQKRGRSQRGRPLTREQSQLATSGRRSRAVSRDVHRELAWMETPGGVQLMSIQVNSTSRDVAGERQLKCVLFLQPILPAATIAPPTFNLPPPHPPTASGQVITVQPRPQPKMVVPPSRHLDNLPTLAPPSTQTLTHKQLETLWRVREFSEVES